jgi:SAM-dependent methyltransferase
VPSTPNHDRAGLGERPAPLLRLERLTSALACPTCHTAIDAQLVCARCGSVGKRRGDQLDFGGFADEELQADPLNRLKERVKRRFGRVYPKIIDTVSPVLSRRYVAGFLRGFDLDQQLVADLGAGTHRRDPRIICVDGAPYDNVDIVADLSRLPVGDGAFAGAISVAVLEHVTDPADHIAEMHRVLAPGGRLLCFVPFMQPFHASPHDFQRYTQVGLRHQFEGFEVLSVGVGSGPTSGLLWVFQEWLAMVLSFGSMRLYRMLVPLTWILSPLKLIDLLLARHPAAHVIASGFFIEVRKPAEVTDSGGDGTSTSA